MSLVHVDHHRKNINHVIVFHHEHVNGRNYRIYYMIDHVLLRFILRNIFICMSKNQQRILLFRRVYFSMGGFEGFKRTTRVYVDTIERYSIENDQWESFSSASPQLSSLAACAYENSIFLGGGKNGQWYEYILRRISSCISVVSRSKIADFYCFSIDKRQLERRASMLNARTTHAFHIFEKKILGKYSFH